MRIQISQCIIKILVHRYICTGGATQPNPQNASEGYMCPTGHYCISGAEIEVGCAIGTYQPNMGQAQCLTCPAGKMCLNANMTYPENCKSGRNLC